MVEHQEVLHLRSDGNAIWMSKGEGFAIRVLRQKGVRLA